jgi:hypothetical protein
MQSIMLRFKKYWDYQWVVVGFILIIGFLLRIWGINFGLPYIYHYDEHFYIATAVKLGSGIVNNSPYAPTGLSNVLFFEYIGYFILGKLVGLFPTVQHFELAYRTNPSMFYLLGRFTSAAFGTASIIAVYTIGLFLTKKMTGIMASILLAVSFIHVRDSHYSVPDIAMSTLVIFAVCFAILYVQTGRQRFIYIASLVGGVAIAMKWIALPVALTIWLAWITVPDPKFIKKTSGNKASSHVIKGSVLVALLISLGFSPGAFQVIINPTPYIKEMIGQASSGQYGGFEIWQVDTLPGWLFYGKTLIFGLGIITVLLAIVGVIFYVYHSIRNKSNTMLILISFPLTYFILMGSTPHYFSRYSLPLVPFVALFCADTISVIHQQLLKWKTPFSNYIILIIFFLAIIPSLASSVKHDLILTRTDTRTIAKDWIEENIPSESKIAVDWSVHGPPLSSHESSVLNSQRVYDVYYVGGTGLSDHTIEWYKQNGYDYLIASSFIYQIPLVFKDLDLRRKEFYSSLDKELQLVKNIYPNDEEREPDFIFDEIYGPMVSLWGRDRPGPVLKIYKIPG